MAQPAGTAAHDSITPPLAFAALVAGAMAMGVSPVFVRTAEIGPFASAFWRVFTALPVLVLWAWLEMRRSGEGEASRLVVFAPPIILSGLFFAGDLTFWHLAIMNTTMANATMMSCLAPVWVLLFSGAFIGEPVPRSSFAGLALCLAGAAMLVGSSYSIDQSRIIGDIYGIITSVFFGLYFLAIRVGRRQAGGGVLTLSSSIVTCAALFVVALASGNDMLPQTAKGYASLAALGLVSHAGGQGLLTLALGVLSAAFSSLVIFLEAFAAALFGWLFFGETLGVMQISGSILILAGVWVARPRQSPQAARR
ncbi:MAG: DMT family transporter [Nitratireductor sp.]|jgi:drug/metabolite transporter (DMT)-like permease|nr:DMT family transporter [Nitratireductor sp.]